jgi:hypothetical protein
MIVSDRHRFAFIHIPKSAGTTVRNTLGAIDDYDGFFARKVDHPAMGLVDLSHIRLVDIADHYPEVFVKLLEYQCCAIVREPEERFMSSIFQRLREFHGIDQSVMTDARIKQEIQAVTEFLATAERRLPLDYVHFMPQVFYVDHEGKRIVKNLFAISAFHDAAIFVQQTTGIVFDAGHRSNSSAALRYRALRPVVRVLKKPYNLLPQTWREALRTKLIAHGVLANQTAASLAMLDEVRPFLTRYYAQDYALYREVAGAR